MAGRSVLVLLCVITISHAVTCRAEAAGDQPKTGRGDRIIRDTEDALEATKDYTLRQKETFQKRVRAELQELHIKIAELRKQTDVASSEVRKDMRKAIVDLEKKKDEARRKLEEVNESTSSAWTTFKAGVTAAVEDLQKSYHDALSKLP